MNLTRRGLLAAGTAASLATACSGSPRGPVASPVEGGFVLDRVDGVRQIAQLTGPGAIRDTTDVLLAGADLGHMTTVGDRTWFVFGDNFGIRADDAFGGTGDVWKSNCLAWTTDDDPTDGITFDGWVLDDLDQVKEVVPGDHTINGQLGEVTKIPTQMFAVGETLYLGYMSVTHWGDPGVWDADHAGLARSTDDGQTWTILDGVTWPGDSNFVQLAQVPLTVDGVDYLYLWAIPAGRFGPVKLMRVQADDNKVADLNSYEYFAGETEGTPTWSKQMGDAVVVLEGNIAELSVMWSTYLNRWVVATMVDNGSAVLFEGLSPWGPWSEPHTIQTQAETPGLYAPYLCPRYVDHDGRRLYFTLSIWGPYQVYWYSMDLQRTGAS